ncbi:hypothetical protein CRH15_19160 [Lelliottia amnigena]|nr:hypothetical protein CO697_15715 [Lelliottia amnigena]PEG63274.1 hypothetical protein CRH15_19160 [Lelliottia amnigena]
MAQSPPPWQPRLPARKSPLRDSLSFSLQAFGPGAILHPCRSRPRRASLRVVPALRKRFGDLQPEKGMALVFLPLSARKSLH